MRAIYHPVERAPIKPYKRHVGPSSKSLECEIALRIPEIIVRDVDGRDFPPFMIVAPRKRPVSFSHFESTHARGSTKYPCDPKSAGRGKGLYCLCVEHRY